MADELFLSLLLITKPFYLLPLFYMKRLFNLLFFSFSFLLLDSNLRCEREISEAISEIIQGCQRLFIHETKAGTGIGQGKDRDWHGRDWHPKGNMILDSGKKGEWAL